MRLPRFITKIPFIGKVLEAIVAFLGLLAEEVARRNRQLSVQTADTGLSLWERDYGLPSDGDDDARRTRIHATRTGEETLTVERLKELALTVGGADEGVVTEKFSRYQVILSALFDGAAPEDLSPLEEAVARRSPAHLDVRVQTTIPAREIAYHGTVTPLSVARSRGCGVDIGGYALYAGGENGSSSAVATTDAYDEQLVRTLPAPLTVAKTNGGVARVGRYAVFAGGATGDNYTVSPTTVYDENLTRTADAALNLGWAQYGGGVTGKSHAVFGDGMNGYRIMAGAVSAVDADLVKTALTPFSVPRAYYGAAATGECVLFAGGGCGSYLSAVDAYGPDLEKLTVPALPVATICPGSAEAGSRAVIAGGRSGDSGYTGSVSAYSPDLALTAAPSLSTARQLFHSVSFGGYAIFAGGCGGSAWYSTVDCYDGDLTHSVLTSLSAAREEYNNANGRGSVVGDFALIFGGRNGGGYFDAVDAFKLI